MNSLPPDVIGYLACAEREDLIPEITRFNAGLDMFQQLTEDERFAICVVALQWRYGVQLAVVTEIVGMVGAKAN
jgi:hypothetical protein